MRFVKCHFCKRELTNNTYVYCNRDCRINYELNLKTGVSLLKGDVFDAYQQSIKTRYYN